MSHAKGLVFITPPPAYVFQQVEFEAQVQLVDELIHHVVGIQKVLQVTLRYHDTYDVVADQSSMDVLSQVEMDASSGSCRLQLKLNMLTMLCDGRAFCLEVRSRDGDLESVFSSPIHVVKEKLRIAQEPPEIWFKDEGGREKCMVVIVEMDTAPGSVLEDRVVPLQLRLLYESGNAVANQSILRLFPDMRPNMQNGRVSISFRIDDVSKNHQGQAFTVEIGPEKQEKSSMFQDIAPVRTNVIAIRSKRNKRKLQGTRASPRNYVGTPRGPLGMMQMNSMMCPMAAGTPTHAMNMNGSVPTSGAHHQRPRQLLGPMSGTPANNHGQYAATPHASMNGRQSGRSAEMMSVGTPMSWSNPQVHASATTPMRSSTPSAVPTPTNGAVMNTMSSSTVGMVEWKLAGFEIHPDGSQNVARPIYRCAQCRRLNDVDAMNCGAHEHASQCPYTTAFRHGPAMSPSVTARYAPTPMNHNAGVMNATSEMPIQGMSNPMMVPTSGSGATISPRNEEVASSTPSHRPVPTISPFMGKATSETSGTPSNPVGLTSNGNLFASSAFHSQMGVDETMSSTSNLKSPTLDEKIAFLNNPLEVAAPSTTPRASTPAVSNHSTTADSSSSPFTGSVTGGSSNDQANKILFNEMNSMGIPMDMDKLEKPVNASGLSDAFQSVSSSSSNLLSQSNGEDQVFYILARMYSNSFQQKLGLPAFNQDKRMLGFYVESQLDTQTQVVFHPLHELSVTEKEVMDISSQFMSELQQNSDAIHSLRKYQHNLIMLREDALMHYWSQSLQSFQVM